MEFRENARKIMKKDEEIEQKEAKNVKVRVSFDKFLESGD